ncbi:MAG: hypothetical protein MJB14_11905 [Spirochaetes bacterium]|nr:hypothetical protein [Spirochaetota bacterium]
MEQVERGNIDGIFRLFTWQPKSISIGQFFKIRNFKYDLMRQDGIRVVRRLSGGYALFHENDLTYSLILRKGILQLDNKREYYLFLAKLLQKALLGLGVQTQIKMDTTVSHSVINCFHSTSQYEMTDYSGKKLIGSAQKILNHSMLQHGSLYYNQPETDFQAYFNLPEIFQFNIASLSNQINEIEKQIIKVFQDYFELKPYELNQEDRKMITKLVNTKYSLDEWNTKR